jgi:uncharacterized ion transporter superfamily protein YfcC
MVSIAFGYTAATFNPFNVGILQTMADLPLFSGLAYRLLFFVCVYVSLVLFLIVYAKKIEKNPEKSLCYESDKELRVRFGAEVDDEALNNPALKKVDAISDSVKELINNLPLVGMAILFTVGGIAAGYIAGIRGKALGGGFLEGVKTIAPCLPMIWAILSITYVLQEGNIIHTILYHVYNLTSSMSKTGALFAIFLFVVALEFIVGSGTAKAFLIMPIVLPLADLLGLTRQSIVLAFTMGDGFCNILYPTSGIMVIAIGMVGISYGKYLRWSWKLFVMEFGLAALAMLGAVAIGY